MSRFFAQLGEKNEMTSQTETIPASLSFVLMRFDIAPPLKADFDKDAPAPGLVCL